MELSKHDQVLTGLVISLQAATMQHLGKITNPVTGKVERDLDQARGTIDILEMLKEKCRQGTPAEILKLLDKAVMELQLNYLDEMKHAQAATAENGLTSDTGEGKDDTDSGAGETDTDSGEGGHDSDQSEQSKES